MKTTIRITSLLLVITMAVFMFAACGKISQSYADKINKAAEKDEHMTYSEVKDDLGEDVVDLTVTIIGSTNGALIAVDDCDSWDDIEEKLEEGKTVKGLYVTIVNNKATKAEYREITTNDK